MPTSPWSNISTLPACSNASFHATVVPLSLMVRLAYTATSGRVKYF